MPDARPVTGMVTTPPNECGNCPVSVGINANGIDLILFVVAAALLFPLLIFIGAATRLSALESAVPLVLGALAAIAAGFVAAGLFLSSQLDYSLVAPGAEYFVIVLLGLVASPAVIASTLPLLQRSTGPETARND
jgi:hypothetical protein